MILEGFDARISQYFARVVQVVFKHKVEMCPKGSSESGEDHMQAIRLAILHN